MPSAWVSCYKCRILVKFGTERRRKDRCYCDKCYKEVFNAGDGSFVESPVPVQGGLEGKVADQGLRRMPVEKAEEGAPVSGGVPTGDDRTEDTVSQGGTVEPTPGVQESEGSSQGTTARRPRRPKGRTWW